MSFPAKIAVVKMEESLSPGLWKNLYIFSIKFNSNSQPKSPYKYI